MSAETKFTPGPWIKRHDHLCRDTAESMARITPANAPEDYFHSEICLIFGCRNEVQNANAHLIAAAPELYEAAEPLEGWFEHFVADAAEWRENDSVQIQLSIKELRAIKAALVKARGES
jgi:hypothetical protein